MALRIKSERAHALAKELAALTGQTLVAVVTQALRERLNAIEETKAAGLEAEATTTRSHGRAK